MYKWCLKKKVVKSDSCGKLVKKVNVIQINDTTNLVKKFDYNTQIDKVDKKIPGRDKHYC